MIYVDCAATSFKKPDRVYEAMLEFARTQGVNPGRAAYQSALEATEALENVRRRLTRFFGAEDTARTVLTFNATDGANIALKGLLKPGDHVVASSFEHTCVLRPLNRLLDDGVIELTEVDPNPDGRISPERIEHAMKKNTRLVAVVHASNVLGTLQPLKEIAEAAHRHGALMFSDCAQTTGILPVDVKDLGLDIMVTTGHKSLLGPPGTGLLIVGENVDTRDIRPWREGGTGDSSAFHPEHYPARLEGGTLNTWGIAGLGEGILFLEELGVEKVFEHEQKLIAKLFDALEGDDRFYLFGNQQAPRIGLLTLNLKGVSPAILGNILDERYGICVRTGLHCAPGAHALHKAEEGGVRISLGWFNTEDEMDKIIAALKECADELAG